MNLQKSYDYFNPSKVNARCHIIGCGSVGSTVAELLARLGLTKISLYDFDTVSSHNIANQMFNEADVGRLKTEAVRDMLVGVNPEAKNDIEIFSDGWTEKSRLSGYVFLCLDSIDLRREIVTKNKPNMSIKAVFDFRTRLEDAQHYAADWTNFKSVETLLKSMNFTDSDAKDATPTSACGITLGVAPTVRVICSLGVANFVNYINGKEIKKFVNADIFAFDIEAH